MLHPLLGTKKWQSIEPKGCVPCPRTYHSTASIDNRMFVFGGGHAGPQPVTDVQMHMFDAGELSG